MSDKLKEKAQKKVKEAKEKMKEANKLEVKAIGKKKEAIMKYKDANRIKKELKTKLDKNSKMKNKK
ncbi:hypothetical protein [Candidatus Hodarchaeum mangrovi]